MAEYSGSQKYLYIRPELTWGSYDSGGTSIYIPYSEYSVKVQNTIVTPQLFTGFWEDRHSRITGKTLAGNLACPLYGYHVSAQSIAQRLITFAMTRTNVISLGSFTGELYEAGADDKHHLGLRCGELTLQGDSSSGVISMSMSLMGKQETGGATVTTLDHNQPQPVEFLFEDTRFFLSDEATASSASDDDSEEVFIESFVLKVTNNIEVIRQNSAWPTRLIAHKRSTTFGFKVIKSGNTYDALRRSTAVNNKAAHLVLKGRHLGTGASGNYTQIDILIDRSNFQAAEDMAGLNELARQQVDFLALKPNTTDQALKFAYSLVA